MITSLTDKQIFVFGSNLAGKHIAGAAKQAKEQFGAIEGQGEGLQGQSYAFPTLTDNFQKFGWEIEESVDNLYKCCLENPDKEFLLTSVGMGIAQYDISEIAPLFKNSPSNLKLPKIFIDYNGI